ncbi:hypothetical protein R3X25_04100 [Lutibacter sp. TH_r2]|uniref:hypothetical protein n=1 Tax=Lutibacter sp. TH_r2 TaxID=3082083 RepID=UPI002953E945|nr:hypothetical protein [Lutibacter sp. TH_r2]MDV7186453.1 hypothetical protein [Lutibacter sp. TH_r2]
MKTISIKFLSIICIFLATATMYSQDENDDDLQIEELTGTFESYDEEQNQFLFSVILEEDGVEMVENYIFIINNKKVEAKYNLKSTEFEGKSFLINYTVEVVSETNEDGDDDFSEVYTIKNITLLN